MTAPPQLARLVVVGASAGGVEALVELARGLPRDFPASVCVVLHVAPTATSMLPTILTRAGALPALHPIDGEPLQAGRIYVAPPDCHLLLEDDHLRVVRGPKENGHRPAVDPLFRSAARGYGPRAIAVLLSGGGDDGTAGALAVKRLGGCCLVQDPEEALTPSMPRSAVETVDVDHCLPLAQLVPMIVELAQTPAADHPFTPAGKEGAVPGDIDAETRAAELDPDGLEAAAQLGVPTSLTCAECGGPLRELDDCPLLRYRCQVGHAYSAEALIENKSVRLEAALWAALNSLEEHSSLARRMASRARERRQESLAQRFERRARNAEEHVDTLRGILSSGRLMLSDPSLAGDPGDDEAVSAANSGGLPV